MVIDAARVALLAVAAVAAVALVVAFRTRRELAQHRRTATATRRRLTTRDPVTGLPNRYAVSDLLRAQREPAAVIVVEVDHLATVQGTLGHDHADALLLHTAERLADELGQAGTLGRLDGGAFVIVSPASVDAPGLADRLLRAVRTPQRLAGIEVVATARAGIASGAVTRDPAELVRRATLALGTTGTDRRIGREDAADRDAELARLRLAHDLRRAVPDHELEVHYQPIVDLLDGRIRGAEALIRWNHPRDGVLLPAVWLDVADESGLLAEIGHATLDEVCRRFATLNAHRRHDPLDVTVNLAASELRQPGLAERVAETLQRTGLAPHLLVIEVGGDVLDDEVAAAALRDLRALGTRVSLDDLGTGFAAVGWRADVPVDLLKLDGALVAHLGHGQRGVDVAAAVLGLCDLLDVPVTAEAVTTEAQGELLRRLGCARAQGWLYGRPLPFSRFAALLDRMDADVEAELELRSDGRPAPAGAVGEAASTLPGLA